MQMSLTYNEVRGPLRYLFEVDRQEMVSALSGLCAVSFSFGLYSSYSTNTHAQVVSWAICIYDVGWYTRKGKYIWCITKDFS